MLKDGKILVGAGVNGPTHLLPAMANRHGLIAGATGTGKTVTLKVLAESFSDLGVPVFLSDIKSDLSGMIRPGTPSEAISKRLALCGVPESAFDFHDFPSQFWDVYGEHGQNVYTTIQAMGPLLLSRMLQLNDTQTGVINILFRYCAEYGYPLNTLSDLKYRLMTIGESARELTLKYGNVSVASVGAIQRAVMMLEDQGGNIFFSEPSKALDIRRDWLLQDGDTGRGVINILSADRLFNNPVMYSTFLLWMLSTLYDILPERGDGDKPVAVFFFDEAHLLFDDCSKTLMAKIEQIVRLIRSKGVGVYFITQNPTDIPMDILGQLGNRVQHALRAYTPLDQKAVRVAAQTFRANPGFDTEEAITTLKTGEALVSFLDENGAPGIVERVTILPPQSRMGAVSEEERSGASVPAMPVSPAPEAPAVPAPVMPASPAPAASEPVPVLPFETAEPVSGPKTPVPVLEFVSVSPTTPEPAQVTAANMTMPNFKVYDPTTGQYVEKEMPQMTPVAQPAAPVASVVEPAAPAAQPVAAAPAMPVLVLDPVTGQYVQQQAAPVVQQMPVMVQDPVTGQYVQKMMTMQQDPATGNWVPVQTAVSAPAAATPAVTDDPIALAARQKAEAAARKEAEKAAKEAEREAKEAEAAARRARADELREEAAERARKNDSVAGRITNTAINTATRTVTNKLTKSLLDGIGGIFGGKKK